MNISKPPQRIPSLDEASPYQEYADSQYEEREQEPPEALEALYPPEHSGGWFVRLVAWLQMVWRNKWLRFGLRLGCTVLLFAFLIHSVSWATVWVKVRKMDIGLLSIGMIVGIFGVIVSAYQLQSLLDAERIRQDLRRLINIYLIGIAFNHFLPTGMGGDVVKTYYIGRESQNTTGAASSVVLARFTGFLAMMLLSVPTVLICHNGFKPALTISFLLSCLAMCVALIGAFLLVTVGTRLTSRWLRGKTLASVHKVGLAMQKAILRPRTMGVAVLFGLCFHFSAALNYYCYAKALGVNSVPMTFFMVAVPFISLISFLPISINGFGVREGAFVYIFSQMNMQHASPEVALVLVLLLDVQVLLHGLVGGAIYMAMGMRKEKIATASVSSSSGMKMPPQELSA